MPELQPFELPDNPCIPYMRSVIEQLLSQREWSYREFYPVLLDHDPAGYREWLARQGISLPQGQIAEYELEKGLRRICGQIDSVLYQLAPGLNRLMICTDRPAYFDTFVQTMYEENGLPVQMEDAQELSFPQNSFVIDFGLYGRMSADRLRKDIFYLPIYRKPWEIAQNLDITVPIGYNTVIVKGAVPQADSSCEDWFEREFYDRS